jgi:hypothetical protein
MELKVTGNITRKEVSYVIMKMKKDHPDKDFRKMILEEDGDFINVTYTYVPLSFQRIRRITGYLVGTLDRFNNAKRAEVKDRVKHGLQLNQKDSDELMKEISGDGE